MANYPLIFGATLIVNVIVTLRSSGLYERFFKKTNGPSSADDGDQEAPLLTTKDSSDALMAQSSGSKEADDKKRHSVLLRKYLVVYLLAILSDWLQGPYVYALYDSYGYSQHDIAVLFVAGFGSSMVFGSFIGGLADSCGRRKFVVLFAAIYAASCATKHYKSYHILMLGRLLGGVATSLLFSVFEAWLIRSHSDAKLTKYLSKSFSSAMYCNSLVAIGSGLLANKVASATDLTPGLGGLFGAAAAAGEGTAVGEALFYTGGYLNPFDIALLALVACGFFAATTWEENYGNDGEGQEDDNAKGGKWYDSMTNAATATWRNSDILLCGAISSFFEGSMYIFVFMWTPALKGLTQPDAVTGEVSLPFGVIFSTFMVCCMIGSSLFSILADKVRGEVIAVGVFAVSSVAMGVIAISEYDTVSFLSMNVFECAVGMYWPIMGTMKGSIVPEDKRAAIYNLFRIPLNFIVLSSLLTDLTPQQSFIANCVMLGTATVLQFNLMKRRANYATAQEASTKEVEMGDAI